MLLGQAQALRGAMRFDDLKAALCQQLGRRFQRCFVAIHDQYFPVLPLALSHKSTLKLILQAMTANYILT